MAVMMEQPCTSSSVWTSTPSIQRTGEQSIGESHEIKVKGIPSLLRQPQRSGLRAVRGLRDPWPRSPGGSTVNCKGGRVNFAWIQLAERSIRDRPCSAASLDVETCSTSQPPERLAETSLGKSPVNVFGVLVALLASRTREDLELLLSPKTPQRNIADVTSERR
jgi:hypothetical protein